MKKQANLKHMWTVGLLLVLIVGLCPLSPTTADSGTTDTAPPQDAGWWTDVEENIRRSEYHVTWQEQTYLAGVTEGAYQAPNRAQNLRTYFSTEGLVVIPRVWPEAGEAPPWRWELKLSAWGRTSALVAVPAAELQVQENRIEYQRGGPFAESGQGPIEWYVNDKNGLEQDFTLATPPAGTPTGEPLQFDLLVGGDLAAELVQDGAAVKFYNPGGEARLRYGSLRAVDAEGRSLPAWLSLQGATLSLFVDDTEAAYPIQIAPTITGLPEDWDWQFVDEDPGGVEACLGWSVATAGDVNGDGYSDVIIGVPYYDWGQTGEGVVMIVYGPAMEIGPRLQVDQANAHFGHAVAPAGDVNGDLYGDIIVGAPHWDDGQTDEGGVWIYLGSSTGLNPEAWDYQDGGQENAVFGWSVATAGDVNGDHWYSDVIVGAPGYDAGEDGEGRVYVWYGSQEKPFDRPHDWRAEGNQAGAHLGHAVAPAGDVNGDGYSDVIVGADLYDNGETNEGAAFVWHGSQNGLNEGIPGDPSNSAWMAQGNQAEAYLGTSVSTAGDVDGDGYADVIVGGPHFGDGQAGEGAAWIFLGSDVGLDSDWVSRKESNEVGAALGYSVATAGDVNGDGYGDIIVGARFYDTSTNGHEGRAWVWYGSPSGPSAASDWHDDGDWVRANFGHSVATAGDVNGDGYSDVIVGAPGEVNRGLVGYVNVYHGGPSTLSDTAGWSRDSNQENADFGFSLGTAGDVNGDGYADIIVGAPYWDGGQSEEGGIWLYHGGEDGPSATSDAHREPNQEHAQFGYAVGTAGDVNGDGYDDVIVGAPLYDDDYENEGVAFVYHGTAEGDGLSQFSDWSRGCNQGDAEFGYAVGSAGDVNGDGYLDVIVGAPYWSNGHDDEGSAWVYHGSADGLSATSNWHMEVNGNAARFGYAVGTAGDVNGDGYSDVVVGAPFWSNSHNEEGGAWVYHGSPEGLRTYSSWNRESNDEEAHFGRAVATAGDVNGDGYSDVIVGADGWSNGEQTEGHASVYHGSIDGLNEDPGWERESDHAGARFGWSVGTAGDVNGDGYADIVVGASNWTNGENDEGSAWVYYGTANGLHTYSDWHAEGDQIWARFGHAVGTAGDVNGDGYADVLVGAPGYKNPTNNEGMAFLYYGNGGPGVSLCPRQLTGFGLPEPLAHLGQMRQSERMAFSLLRRTPFGWSDIDFQLELKRLGQNLDGTDTRRWAMCSPGDGQPALKYYDVESDNTHYHWRVRWLYWPTKTPWMPASRWLTVPWNGWNEADFRTPKPRVFLPLVLRQSP